MANRTNPLICVYDNPATMALECWQDGRLVAAYQAELYFLKDWPVPADRYFFGANIGPWLEGQMVGNQDAMKRLTQTDEQD